MKALVLLNRTAGCRGRRADGVLMDRVQAAFRAAGVGAEVLNLLGVELSDRVRQAAHSSVDVVVAGGGDGTVSTVAGVLAGTSKPLGVLPLGTLNHFARDLGLPLVLEEAVQIIAGGVARCVDVAEVNNHVFINNSSLGIYPHIVRERDQLRIRLGRNKWLALAPACLTVFRRYPLVEVRLEAGVEMEHLTTPLLFVGNNKYQTNLLAMRGRASLDRGELCLYLVKGRGRFTLVRLALLSLLGLLDQDRDFWGRCLPAFRVDTPQRLLPVAADGEVIFLSPPLQYRVRPGALRVILGSSESIITSAAEGSRFQSPRPLRGEGRQEQFLSLAEGKTASGASPVS